MPESASDALLGPAAAPAAPASGDVSDAPPPELQIQGAARAHRALLRIRDLHKSFGSLHVLRGIDLDIPRGKTTVVLGPSGCGKSVMLKLINGLMHPDRGEIWFDNQRIDDLPERKLRDVRRRMGFLFQMGALFDSMTIAENIEFPLVEHTKLGKGERRQRVLDALDTVDLKGIAERLPSQLSGGQRKRVALARAIVLEPKLVLYDEPTTGLDPIRSDGIDQLVNKLERQLGVTSVVVTHDLNSARKIAEQVVLLLDGLIAAQGTFADLERSTNPRVQQFIRGEYRRDDDALPTPSVE
ncbi:MAG: ABC transporter ATP-binding protein [Planctomycetota bacterium]|nr:ABC transporter ATP-binding protein [Planctomycetota bacterium]